MTEGDYDVEAQLALTDLVNRVLDRGVTVVGDVMISVAGVDLVYLGIRLDLAAVEEAVPKSASGRLASVARRRFGSAPEAG
jgi:hypothetical protein